MHLSISHSLCSAVHNYDSLCRRSSRSPIMLSILLVGASVSESHLGSSTRCLSVYIYIYILYIYISYVRHFWSRGPRATRKRKPAHLKFKGHMHACCICSKRQPGHHYTYCTYRASTHVQQLSDNQQRRLEAETTHEREERLQH